MANKINAVLAADKEAGRVTSFEVKDSSWYRQRP